MEPPPIEKFPCPLCRYDCSRSFLPYHLTNRHFDLNDCDLEQLNAGADEKDQFDRCGGCRQFLRRGNRGRSKHVCKDNGSRRSGPGEAESDLDSLMSDRSESIGSDRGLGIISAGGVTTGINIQDGGGNQEVGSTSARAIGSTINPTNSQVENLVEELEVLQRAEVDGNIGTGGNVDVGGAGTSGLGTANTRRPRAEYSVTLMADLIAQFQQGLHFYHHTWLEPMRDISIKCWDLARGNLENVAMINYAGFLILPGLISVMRKIKGGQKIVDFLISTSKSSTPGVTVVKKARLVLSELEADRRRRQGREFRSPTVDSLSKQVDKYIDEDRLSAAVGVVSRIHDLMENVEESHVPLTPEQIREKIASLHPAQDEYDILPPDKSSDPDGIQVN